MYLDHDNEFSDNQAITVTAPSTYLDLGENKGAGEELQIHASVTEDFTSGNGTTLTVSFESDSDSGFGTKVTHWTTPAIAKTVLEAGYDFDLPPLPAFHGRYVRLYFTVATGPFTAGKVAAGIVHDRQTNKGNF